EVAVHERDQRRPGIVSSRWRGFALRGEVIRDEHGRAEGGNHGFGSAASGDLSDEVLRHKLRSMEGPRSEPNGHRTPCGDGRVDRTLEIPRVVGARRVYLDD